MLISLWRGTIAVQVPSAVYLTKLTWLSFWVVSTNISCLTSAFHPWPLTCSITTFCRLDRGLAGRYHDHITLVCIYQTKRPAQEP